MNPRECIKNNVDKWNNSKNSRSIADYLMDGHEDTPDRNGGFAYFHGNFWDNEGQRDNASAFRVYVFAMLC